jgi:hypothetical protein
MGFWTVRQGGVQYFFVTDDDDDDDDDVDDDEGKHIIIVRLQSSINTTHQWYRRNTIKATANDNSKIHDPTTTANIASTTELWRSKMVTLRCERRVVRSRKHMHINNNILLNFQWDR